TTPRAYTRAHPRVAALRCSGPVDQARLARQLPWPEADLVPVALHRTRLRRAIARVRASRVRRVALERVLDSARIGDRVQARSLSARVERVEPLRRPPALPSPGART